MSDNKSAKPIIKPLNFRVQLILFLVSGTLWEPFFNLVCFLGLNQIAAYPAPEGVPPTKNNVLVNILLILSIFGAPVAWYRRYQILHEYIDFMEPHLPALPKKVNENGEEEEVKRPTCLTGKRFIGFAITTTLILLLLASSFTIVIYYLIQFNQGLLPDTFWGNGAFMLFLPIGIAAFFIGLGFSVRTAIEEKKWFKAFNSISAEIMALNKK